MMTVKRLAQTTFILSTLSFLFCARLHFKDIGEAVSIEIPESFQKESKDCFYPSTFPLTIQFLNGSAVTFNLIKNTDEYVNSPFYVIRNDSNGEPIVVREELEEITDVSFYQDVRSDASIEVRCKKNILTETQIIFTGSYAHSGRQYKLSVVNDLDLFQGDVINGEIKYQVAQKLADEQLANDYRSLPIEETTVKRSVARNLHHLSRVRSQRDVSLQQPYIVDLLVIADYEIYKSWHIRSVGATDFERDIIVKNGLRRYFSHFINEIDLRYKSIKRTDIQFSIHIAGFIVADTVQTYPWLEHRKELGDPRSFVNADEALKDFRSWVKKTHTLPLHDHAMLFTGFDLYSLNSTRERIKHTAGLAFIGSMCRTGDSVSVVEDHGGFQNVGTAAHELGHSLGAVHDGEYNDCSSNERFIMAASGSGTIPQEKRLHQWHFSSCSVNYFKTFVEELPSKGYTCLTEKYEDVGLHPTDIPGQTYDPDEQCRLIWGPTSYLCRGYEFGNASSICTSMYCRDPKTSGDCVLHFAARGTSCGNKKWCESGRCVLSQEAPEIKGSCILGDQPGIAFIGKSCTELVNEVPAYCYQEKVRARCCESCNKHFTWKSGCEYGDRVKGCMPWHCDTVNNNSTIQSDCCGTCNIGEDIITTDHPNFTVDPGITATPIPPVPGSCLDKANVNDKSCKDFILANGPHVCYDPVIESFCCDSCSKIRESHTTDCWYGDRRPSMCTSYRNVTTSWCTRYAKDCCRTCHQRLNGASVPSLSFSLTFFILTILSLLL